MHTGCIESEAGNTERIQKPVRIFKAGVHRVRHVFHYKCFGMKLNYIALK